MPKIDEKGSETAAEGEKIDAKPQKNTKKHEQAKLSVTKIQSKAEVSCKQHQTEPDVQHMAQTGEHAPEPPEQTEVEAVAQAQNDGQEKLPSLDGQRNDHLSQ